MTINVALVSRDALILGCDSVASVTSVMLEPWQYLEKNPDGSPRTDEDGTYVARFDWSATKTVVTDVWGGVTKMFELHNNGARVAATTAGLAALNDRSIASLGVQFLKDNSALRRDTVQEVAEAFLAFVRAEYDRQYADPNFPDDLKSEVEFLVGGYGVNDNTPALYRLSTKGNRCECIYPPGEYGVAWAGQSDAVARVFFGYDQRLPFRANRQAARVIDDMHKEFSEAITRILGEILAKVGIELPADVNTELPEKPTIALSLSEFHLDVEIENLPLQDTVELVSFLVNLQAGRSKFVRGVATVGGRTRIGVLTKTSDFEMLNEPEIVHRNTGFAFDF